MTFVSYAQNFEDLMLWRALKDVVAGFYIDAGANHPVHESVTHVFYEAGWSGINLEPDPRPFADLVKRRPRDINLPIGAWSSKTTLTFHAVQDSAALSTFSERAHDVRVQKGHATTATTVPVQELQSIIDEHAPNKTIHFLKVDVEGGEFEVFSGMNFARHRPWIILFETNGPDPTTTHHKRSEDLLLSSGYDFVYFDGLNRFYTAKEQTGRLSRAWLSPPNVYDEWVRYRDLRWLPRAAFPEGVSIPAEPV